MTDSLFEAVAHATRELTKYGFSTQEFAMLVQQHNMTDAEALAVAKVFDYGHWSWAWSNWCNVFPGSSV